MKKQKKQKSNAQLIIGALLTGKHLRSRDISEMVLEKEGKKIKIQDVASMLSKISNTEKSDLGYFIKRVKKGNSFTYNMVKEVLKLSEEKAYELTLKIGKDRYTLEQALKEFPSLKKYVKPGARPKSKPQPKKAVVKNTVKKADPPKSKPVKAAKSPAESVMTISKPQDIEKIFAEIIRKVAGVGKADIQVDVAIRIEGSED
ncbi:hypothetical protein [Desulfonema magnum]|uniref:Uncharacterized protein n=1 Tax=Desulfonema magnum TaxID=45655 RepID=A0A975BMB7_9BACT|nr:hypothetical protein [Desulfonema magnum]QTA88118.1 Uncharacterized protein dnm_041580 [Desulfonema magnum]